MKMKKYKVIFVGRAKGLKKYHRMEVTINLNNKPKCEAGVLPELNKTHEVYSLIEIWELIYEE